MGILNLFLLQTLTKCEYRIVSSYGYKLICGDELYMVNHTKSNFDEEAIDKSFNDMM